MWFVKLKKSPERVSVDVSAVLLIILHFILKPHMAFPCSAAGQVFSSTIDAGKVSKCSRSVLVILGEF